MDYLNCWFDCFPDRIKHDASQNEYSSRIILGGDYNCIITFEQANQRAPNVLFTCMCGINKFKLYILFDKIITDKTCQSTEQLLSDPGLKIVDNIKILPRGFHE